MRSLPAAAKPKRLESVRESYLAMTLPQQANFRARVLHLIALRRLRKLKFELLALDEKLLELADKRDALIERVDAVAALTCEALKQILRSHDEQNVLESDQSDFPADPSYSASPF